MAERETLSSVCHHKDASKQHDGVSIHDMYCTLRRVMVSDRWSEVAERR